MRNVLPLAAACAMFVMVAGTAIAQKDYSNRTATASLTAGLATDFGASMIIDPETGTKVSPIFAYRVAAAGTFPLTPVISSSLAFGYASSGTKIRDESNADVYSITRVNYFTITPGFQFSAFYIGMNFGFPMGGTVTTKLGTGASESSRDMTTNEEDKLLTLLEPRLGAVIPLLEDKTGWLGLTVMAGYSLNELVDRGDNLPSDRGSYNTVAAYLGLTYQLSIPGTARR